MWSQLKTVLLLGALAALSVVIVIYVAPGWAMAAAAVAVIFNLGMFFYSDRLVLRMHGARPIAVADDPGLHQINDQLAQAAGIPVPRLYLIEADYANAFATGRGPSHAAIAVTQGLLDRLTSREVRGVLAHEMAHVANRDVLIATIAAMLAAIVSAVANALQFSALFGGGASQPEDGEEHGSLFGALAFALIAPVGVTLVQLAISRSREYVADETAARLTGDPEALASALQRLNAAAEHDEAEAVPAPATASLFIVNPLAGAASRLLALLSTHPPAALRIARLLELAALQRRAA